MISAYKKFCASIVDCTADEWQAMEAILKEKQLSKHEHFLQEGETCLRMGFIVKGSTRLYFLVNGEEVTKDFCFENGYTGSLASFLSRKPSLFNVVAMEDSTLLTFDYEALMDLYKKYPCWNTFGRRLTEAFAIRKENREVFFLLNSPEQRYAELLGRFPYILQRVPLKQIASYMGVSAETLSRIRKKLS